MHKAYGYHQKNGYHQGGNWMDVGQLHMRLIKNYIVFRQESHLLQTP